MSQPHDPRYPYQNPNAWAPPSNQYPEPWQAAPPYQAPPQPSVQQPAGSATRPAVASASKPVWPFIAGVVVTLLAGYALLPNDSDFVVSAVVVWLVTLVAAGAMIAAPKTCIRRCGVSAAREF